MFQHVVSLSHQWEATHRLPHLEGKCVNLHGHSWKVTVDIAAPTLTSLGTVVEFGAFKDGLRKLIDVQLDHAAMLGQDDPLLRDLRQNGMKVYVFTDPWPWPTVELVAARLANASIQILDTIRGAPATAPGAQVVRVEVRETDNNTATWRNGL